MRDNMTDKDEAELLKYWWNEYGKVVVFAVLVGLALSYGWRYWRQYKIDRAAAASVIYQSLSVSDQQGASLDQQKNQVELLITKYRATPYAALAQFVAAKEAVAAKRYTGAIAALHWITVHSDSSSFRQLAKIRIAKIYLQQSNPKKALSMLGHIENKAYAPMIDSVKGDAYSSLGSTAKATLSYQEALVGYAAMGIQDPVLKLKLSQ